MNLPKNEDIIALLAPSVVGLATGAYAATQIEVIRRHDGSFVVEIASWDSANEKFHRGKSFEEVVAIRNSFDPLERAKKDLEYAQKRFDELAAKPHHENAI